MQGDAFANYIEEHPKGSIVEGVISQIDDKSITVSLTEEVWVLFVQMKLLLNELMT